MSIAKRWRSEALYSPSRRRAATDRSFAEAIVPDCDRTQHLVRDVIEKDRPIRQAAV
jgi:hypothetical protein